ncbi:MAG: hypothetical protein RL318_3067 [Fibrobacterota bacterium]|jgi:predicted Rossmann fold flavoprotein
MQTDQDVIVIGAGASGLMCAIEAGKRGRKVMVLDHRPGPGSKILIAGGGRCNFTNLHVTPKHYVSGNPHFCKSALSRFTARDFLELVTRHGIPFEERSHGQLFCRHKARDLLDMLLAMAREAQVEFRYDCEIASVAREENGFMVRTSLGSFQGASLVVATGGLSIPTVGASPLGYKIAEQFGLSIMPVSAGLVPFTLQPQLKEQLAELPGIAVPATLTVGDFKYTENLLFTHRGLSGPVVLQASNHWSLGQEVCIDLLPGQDLSNLLAKGRVRHPDKQVRNLLVDLLPKRLAEAILPEPLANARLVTLIPAQVTEIVKRLQDWRIKPAGTEGYRTAEVTRGGVDCNALSSKTMEARKVPGLYFIGEVVDVTGALGGYNLQWAWASGWCAGQYV